MKEHLSEIVISERRSIFIKSFFMRNGLDGGNELGQHLIASVRKPLVVRRFLLGNAFFSVHFADTNLIFFMILVVSRAIFDAVFGGFFLTRLRGRTRLTRLPICKMRDARLARRDALYDKCFFVPVTSGSARFANSITCRHLRFSVDNRAPLLHEKCAFRYVLLVARTGCCVFCAHTSAWNFFSEHPAMDEGGACISRSMNFAEDR